MNILEKFSIEQDKINKLDYRGFDNNSAEMLKQYQLRNSFGLDQNTKIHRIFQKDFYTRDIAEGYITLPQAAASVWLDNLENPLADVVGFDSLSGGDIDIGFLVRSFYALCWTDRALVRPQDWNAFSHGKKAVRISTTVGKLVDRMMTQNDGSYMHRSWVVNVEYKDPTEIMAMKTPVNAFNHMESSGAMLAASAAVVQTKYSHENEVRLLMDDSFSPSIPGIIYESKKKLVRIPFDWSGFVDKIEYH